MLAVFAANALMAQTDEQLDKIAQVTCDCVEKKDISSMDQETMTMELGFCMIGYFGSDIGAMEDMGLKMTDQASMQAFGEKVGLKMVNKCPNIMMKLGMMSMEEQTTEETVMVSTITGKITGFEGDDLSYVLLEADGGRKIKLLWLDYFDGADMLKNSIGKTATFEYESFEFYSVKMEDYIARKVIVGVKY